MFIRKEDFEAKLKEVKELGIRANNIAKLLALISLERDREFWDLYEIMDLLGCNKRTANDYLYAIREILKNDRIRNYKFTFEELKEIKKEFEEDYKTIRQKALRNLLFLWKYNVENWHTIQAILWCSVGTAEYYAKAIEYLKKLLG